MGFAAPKKRLVAFWLAIPVALAPAQVLAQAPSGYIPALNAKVTSIRFFEGPNTSQVPPREGRQYAVQFDRTRTRKIFWEINLTHPAPGRRIYYTLETVWHTPTDVEKGGYSQVSHAQIEGHWDESYWSNGLRVYSRWKVFEPGGRVYRRQEPWGPGTYRLDFFVGGHKVASGSFQMREPSQAASQAATHFNQGVERMKKLDCRAAIGEFTRAIQLKPDYAAAYSNRGGCRHLIGEDREAVNDATVAIRLKPDYADAYMNRAIAHGALGNHKAALEDYTQAIRFKPDDAGAYYNRAGVRASLGDGRAAREDYQRAADLYQKQRDRQGYQNAVGKLGSLRVPSQ